MPGGEAEALATLRFLLSLGAGACMPCNEVTRLLRVFSLHITYVAPPRGGESTRCVARDPWGATRYAHTTRHATTPHDCPAVHAPRAPRALTSGRCVRACRLSARCLCLCHGTADVAVHRDAAGRRERICGTLPADWAAHGQGLRQPRVQYERGLRKYMTLERRLRRLFIQTVTARAMDLHRCTHTCNLPYLSTVHGLGGS